MKKTILVTRFLEAFEVQQREVTTSRNCPCDACQNVSLPVYIPTPEASEK